MVTVNAATTVTATFTGGPVTLVAVQSRKTHGGAGTLGLPVDTVPVIGGAVTVESRISGATAANFKFDVNATGAVNASDISAVKARSGLTLP